MHHSDDLLFQPLQLNHIDGVRRVLDRCFPDMPASDQLSNAELRELCRVFPEGTVVVSDGKRIIGMGSGIFLDLDFDNLPPREVDLLYDEMERSRHQPDGLYYYGADIGVDPAYQGRGIGRRIYRWRKDVVRRHNRKGFVAAGVLPGYADHRDELDIHDYVDKVVKGELRDPTLSMQLRNGFQVRRLLHNFYEFPRSDNWSTLIVWENPDYEPR